MKRWVKICLLLLLTLDIIMGINGYMLILYGIPSGNVWMALICGLLVFLLIKLAVKIIQKRQKWFWKMVKLSLTLFAVFFIFLMVCAFYQFFDFVPKYTVLNISGDQYENKVVALETRELDRVGVELYIHISPVVLKHVSGYEIRYEEYVLEGHELWEESYGIAEGDYEAWYDAKTRELHMKIYQNTVRHPPNPDFVFRIP